MAERRTTVDGLADAIMDGLKKYADLATDTVKDAVKDASKTVKKEIQANAPKQHHHRAYLCDVAAEPKTQQHQQGDEYE